MRLEFHPEAELELIEAAVHYELQVPGLGERFEAEVRRVADLLMCSALRWLHTRAACPVIGGRELSANRAIDGDAGECCPLPGVRHRADVGAVGAA